MQNRAKKIFLKRHFCKKFVPTRVTAQNCGFQKMAFSHFGYLCSVFFKYSHIDEYYGKLRLIRSGNLPYCAKKS